MPPKKGQVFVRYSDEIKKEAVRLRLEERLTYAKIRERLGIKGDAQIIVWVRRHQNGESFEDYRGSWGRKKFSNLEEENAYLKAHLEYLKKLNPNLHGEGSWISKPGFVPLKK